jgi:hypothetical protein
VALPGSAAGISLAHMPCKVATQAAPDIAGSRIAVGFQGPGTAAMRASAAVVNTKMLCPNSSLKCSPDGAVGRPADRQILLAFAADTHGPWRQCHPAMDLPLLAAVFWLFAAGSTRLGAFRLKCRPVLITEELQFRLPGV